MSSRPEQLNNKTIDPSAEDNPAAEVPSPHMLTFMSEPDKSTRIGRQSRSKEDGTGNEIRTNKGGILQFQNMVET